MSRSSLGCSFSRRGRANSSRSVALAVMDVARVVNEDAVPEPIVSDAEETTEIVPSAALEEDLGLDEEVEEEDTGDLDDPDDEELPEDDYTDDHLGSV